MPSLKDIKKRIGSVKNTQQITKAMKMVSAAKLRRAQEAVVASRPYSDKMLEVIASLAAREDAEAHPLLLPRDKRRALLVVLTTDRGLCGGFNANICKTTERFVRKNEDGFEAYDLMIIGRKGKEYLKSRGGLNVAKVYENITGSISFGTASLLGQEIVKNYIAEQYDAVYLVYNAFRSAITQVVTISQLLPIIPKMMDDGIPMISYLYEPNRAAILAELLPKNVEVQIFRSLLESVASEHGARMSAMDSASKNAKEMIGKLTLQYNRARQAAITKELMEIISGAESVKN